MTGSGAWLHYGGNPLHRGVTIRVFLTGSERFGAATYAALRAAGLRVVGVAAPSREGSPDPLAAAAGEGGDPVIPTHLLKRDPAAQARLRALEPDLMVMAFVTHIIPGEVLAVPRHGAIQFHPSLLPRHRGRSAVNWAITQGETETGLTIFWVDAGIDTGPILLQERVPIDPDDTVNSLYFNKLFQPGVEALVRATRLIAEGQAPRIPQDESQATYEPPMERERAAIDWERPAREVYNLIRGCNRQPGAWSTVDGQEVTLLDCRLVEDGVARLPGGVEGVAEDAVEIGLRGGLLRVSLFRTATSPRLSATEVAAELGLRPGSRFGAPQRAG